MLAVAACLQLPQLERWNIESLEGRLPRDLDVIVVLHPCGCFSIARFTQTHFISFASRTF